MMSGGPEDKERTAAIEREKLLSSRMSDEPYEHDLRFLIALDVLTDERRQQAFAALASLESQHQALQERLSGAEEIVGKRALAVMKYGEPKALQERAEKAEARLRGHETCECGHTLCQHEPRSFGCADLHGPCALSPTQETDQIVESGTSHAEGKLRQATVSGDGASRSDGSEAERVLTPPSKPPLSTRPTQETDPE